MVLLGGNVPSLTNKQSFAYNTCGPMNQKQEELCLSFLFILDLRGEMEVVHLFYEIIFDK